jgi:hypothetical protein
MVQARFHAPLALQQGRALPSIRLDAPSPDPVPAHCNSSNSRVLTRVSLAGVRSHIVAPMPIPELMPQLSDFPVVLPISLKQRHQHGSEGKFATLRL